VTYPLVRPYHIDCPSHLSSRHIDLPGLLSPTAPYRLAFSPQPASIHVDGPDRLTSIRATSTRLPTQPHRLTTPAVPSRSTCHPAGPFRVDFPYQPTPSLSASCPAHASLRIDLPRHRFPYRLLSPPIRAVSTTHFRSSRATSTRLADPLLSTSRSGSTASCLPLSSLFPIDLSALPTPIQAAPYPTCRPTPTRIDLPWPTRSTIRASSPQPLDFLL
jgi:hypothetical protein